MDLIYYRGLNCRLACIINLAHLLGVNYTDAFATLWSEADFIDEVKYNIYTSKRILINLEASGIATEPLNCGESEIEESMSQISDGEMFFIGMDTFDIPWHPVYKSFHDPHYFFAKKETPQLISCFDPVYNQKDIRINSRDIFSSAFELCRVHRVDAASPKHDILKEAKAVLSCHPKTKSKLLAEILKCENEDVSNIFILLKQINAMLNNRYLFLHFWRSSALIFRRHEAFFGEAYFLKWEAVRNGLYKASVIKENKSVINEVYSLFDNLMREEIAMAEEILAIGENV